MPDLSNWGQHGRLREDVPYGQHIALTCKKHPEMTWHTKNIAPIGARNIFFDGAPGERECDCSINELIVKP